MTIEVLADAEDAAHHAAQMIAIEARAAVRARGSFTFAVSGGRTPLLMFRALSALELPWKDIHVLQVDERLAPANHADRNLTHLAANLLVPPERGSPQFHAMPVEPAGLELAATSYSGTLVKVAGSPPVLDLVHLGLGSDGHTASLIPGDPVLDVTDADVALTGAYQGRRRMTLTYPILNRARRVLWLVTGEDKAAMLVRLRDRDPSIPAGRIRQDHAVVFADGAAARRLETV